VGGVSHGYWGVETNERGQWLAMKDPHTCMGRGRVGAGDKKQVRGSSHSL